MVLRRSEWPAEEELVICTVTKVFAQGAFAKLDEYTGKEGMIHVSGAITPLGIRLSATCTAQLANGQVEVTIERATIAGLHIPGFLLSYASQIIEESIEDMQIDITELKILPGKLVIGGTR